jgi:hypothetical protein
MFRRLSEKFLDGIIYLQGKLDYHRKDKSDSSLFNLHGIFIIGSWQKAVGNLNQVEK